MMAKDDDKQQAGPIPPVFNEPFAAPAAWPGRQAPHGTFQGLGMSPAPGGTGQQEGDARRTPSSPVQGGRSD
jgi:hypothetical protein